MAPELRSAAPYYKTLSILTRSPCLSAPSRRGSTLPPKSSSSLSTAFRNPMSRRAIPITINAGDVAAAARAPATQRRANAAELPVAFWAGEWLHPYTDETVKALARKGVKRMAVLTPGFSVDCLETVSEIGIENREFFIEKAARISR